MAYEKIRAINIKYFSSVYLANELMNFMYIISMRGKIMHPKLPKFAYASLINPLLALIPSISGLKYSPTAMSTLL